MAGKAPVKRARPTKTIDSVVGSRGPRFDGAFYKLAPNSPSLAIDLTPETPPYVDLATMSARAIISTPTLDRCCDLLMPQGCKLDNYRKNPVVLWSHGFGEIALPIGKSEDAAGNLAIRITGETVEATCYFSQSLLEAEQIFSLICEGIVRATSVRETPIKSSWMHDPQLGDLLLVDEWDLEEWSWCEVGMNPDAVAKAIGRNRLAGKPIAPSIMKSLSAIAPGRQVQGLGFKFAKDESVKVKYTKAQLKSMSDADLAKAKSDAEDPAMVDTEEKERKDAADAAASTPDADAADDSQEMSDDAVAPYGQQVLSAVYASLSTAVSSITSAMGPLENTEVKEALGTILASLNEQVAATEGIYSSAYPDAKKLAGESADETAAAESMKSFLAAGRGSQYVLLGVSERLKSMASAKNLTPEQRKQLTECSGHATRLVTQAKAHKPAATKTDEPPAEDPAKVAALQKQIDDLKKLVPAD